MKKVERTRLLAELRKLDAEIDAAYWRFTRQAKAAPPSMQVPGAYRRRNELLALLGIVRYRARPSSASVSEKEAHGCGRRNK